MDARQPKQFAIRIGADQELKVHVAVDDANRFTAVFEEAYSRLPKDVKNAIESHWAPIDELSPEISVEDVPYIGSSNDAMAGMAMTENIGKRIRFCAYALDWLLVRKSKAVAVSLVVHELAHVHSFAQWTDKTITPEENDAYLRAIKGDESGRIDLERMVDDRVRHWGFDPYALQCANDEFLRHLGLIS